MIDYNIIYEFLEETKNNNRLDWLINLIENNFKDVEIDVFHNDITRKTFVNIYLVGNSKDFIVAHHDVINPLYCANDNSASIINCLIYKQNNPTVNVALLDGEEPPYFGAGSKRLSKLINDGKFGEIENVFNLELTGVGRNICISKHELNSTNKIIKESNIKIEEISTPFSDADIFILNKINSECIFLLPDNESGGINKSYISYCHTEKDNESIINVDDMKNFVTNILPEYIERG